MAIYEEVELVGYDVNGTLFKDASNKTAPFWFALNGIFVRFNMEPLPLDILRREFGQFGQHWTKIYRDRGITETMASDQKLYEIYDELYGSQPPAPPFEGLPETLQWLRKRGIILAIVTTQRDSITIPHLEGCGLRKFFASVKGGIGDKTEALCNLLDEFRVAPERAAYVGDQESDVVYAKAAGCISIGFCGGVHSLERLEKVKPDFLIHQHSEIKQLPIFG